MRLVYNRSGSGAASLQATGDNAITVSSEEKIQEKIPWQCRPEMNDRQIDVDVSLHSDYLTSLLRDALFSINGIESIHLARDETTIDVWIVIPERDIGLVRKIAETERSLMSHFVNHRRDPLFYFDFHTVYRGTNDLQDLIPRKTIEIPSG